MRQFGRTVTKEWALLRSTLPPNIFVRACERNMDLLRAVLLGPHGAPLPPSHRPPIKNISGVLPEKQGLLMLALLM